MKNLLDNFLKHLSLHRHASPHTLRSYESDLGQFMAFLSRTKNAGDPPDPARVDHRVLRAFLAELQVAGMRKSTTARKLAALRSFFKYLHRIGGIPENPARPLLTPKQEKPLPTFLTREEAHHLMAAPEGNTLAILRDRAILETFYSSGLRVAELAGLTLESLSLDEGFLRVRGKGNKERIVPLGSHAVTAIRDYLRGLGEIASSPSAPRNDSPGGVQRPGKSPKPPGGSLFRNLRGGPLTSRGIYDVVRKYAGPLSPHKRVTPHSLRHSFASHLLDGGADLRSVQEMLGHANLSTTQKYTHVTVDRLMAVYDQAHPRSKKGVEEPEENQ